MKGTLTGIDPAIADCGLQGTATSPSSTVCIIITDGQHSLKRLPRIVIPLE